MDMVKLVGIFVAGVILGLGIAYLTISKDAEQEAHATIIGKLETGIVKEGYYSSIEDAAMNLGVPIYFKPCKGDPNTVVSVGSTGNGYYSLARCTITKRGYYCVKIESDHATPNFVYWYSKCLGVD